jgi:hypothetical protein
MYIGCVNHYAILIFMKYMHSRISYFDRMEKQIRDDVLSLNNSKLSDFVDRIYPIRYFRVKAVFKLEVRLVYRSNQTTGI